MSFQVLFDFEQAIAEYTGAPYVVVTDGCTHAIELAMRYYQVKQCQFTAYTYLSIPQMLTQTGISYQFVNESWQGEYRFHGTNIWDSARRLEHNMYRPGQVQCLSFGNSKPVQLGRVGAMLLDDVAAYRTLSKWRSDGRDLSITPWPEQMQFGPGYHYCPTLEDCAVGIKKLAHVTPTVQKINYPDLRKLLFC